MTFSQFLTAYFIPMPIRRNKYSSFIFYSSFVLNSSFSNSLISALSLLYPTLNAFDILFISYDSAKTKKNR